MAGKPVTNDPQRRLAARLLKEAAEVAEAEPARAKELARRAVVLLDAADIVSEFGT